MILIFYQAAVAVKIRNLFVSVALICLVLYWRKIYLLIICILYCLVSLNSKERDVAQR